MTEANQTTHTIAEELIAERSRQVSVEGWSPRHDDDDHNNAEIARAAAAYCLTSAGYSDHPEGTVARIWPWDEIKPKNPRRDLVRAGALIIAEIERLDRDAIRRVAVGPHHTA